MNFADLFVYVTNLRAEVGAYFLDLRAETSDLFLLSGNLFLLPAEPVVHLRAQAVLRFAHLLAQAVLGLGYVAEKPLLQELEELLLLGFSLLCPFGLDLAKHSQQGIGSSVAQPFLQRARHRKYCHPAPTLCCHPGGVNEPADA